MELKALTDFNQEMGSTGISGAILPPLVSFVLINWNYATYVGSAIDSIRAQEYPNFECLVIDNGSTDHSRDVIKKHIEGDARFRLLAYPENIGQLGAAFSALDEIRGGFVTFVDADDVLFDTYTSTHLLAHFSLPEPVAFTSSNVVEIDASGHALSLRCNLTRIGDNSRARLAKLANVSFLDSIHNIAAQNGITDSVWTIPRQESRWVWGPGTSNMYRASILRLVNMNVGSKMRPHMRAADGYFNPICHALAGSALIDLHVSAYRIHRRNYFATTEKFNHLRTGSEEFEQSRSEATYADFEFFLENVERYDRIIIADYFSFLDSITRMTGSRKKLRQFYSKKRVFMLFLGHARQLRVALGWRGIWRNILRRFSFVYALRILGASLMNGELNVKRQ